MNKPEKTIKAKDVRAAMRVKGEDGKFQKVTFAQPSHGFRIQGGPDGTVKAAIMIDFAYGEWALVHPDADVTIAA